MPEKKETALAGAARWNHYDGFHDSTRWLRVTSRNRCPICDHGGWCLISPDGAVAGCMRQDRGAFCVARTQMGEMFLHRLSNDRPLVSRIPAKERRSEPRTAIASPEQRHRVYSAFVDALTLSEHHAAELRNRRGLSEETVTRNLYATVPPLSELTALVSDLASDFDLAGMPGFWHEHGREHCEARSGELLIPVRDERARITAILRGTSGVPKYLWMSSKRGVSCGTPVHFALPCLADLQDGANIVIAEGILKSDCIAERWHTPVIGLPGVWFPEDLGQRLVQRFPRRGAVLVAFDVDERRNPHVRSALVRLLRLLGAAGVTADRLEWDESLGKGLDDVLTGGHA